MHLKQFLFVGCLSLFALASCDKKNTDLQPAITIEGNWSGKYSILSEPFSNHYAFAIKAGGVLELRDAAQQKTGEGTWTLNGTLFTGTYSLLPPGSGVYSVIATFDHSTSKLDGTWGIGAQEYGGGYWYMHKTN